MRAIVRRTTPTAKPTLELRVNYRSGGSERLEIQNGETENR